MLKALCAALLGLGIAVCGDGASQPPSPSGRESQSKEDTAAAKHHTDPQDTQRGTPDSPFIIQIQQSPSQNPVATKPENESQWYARPDWWVVIFTGLLFSSTTGLWVFTALLWGSTRELVISSGKTDKLQLRAYISITPSALRRISPDDTFHLAFTLLNGGSTPAFQAVHAGEMLLVEHPLPNNFPFPQLTIDPKSRMVIQPHIPIRADILASKKFTKEEIIEILEGKAENGKRLYVFGKVDYNDIFGDGHWTKFCFSFPGWFEAIDLAGADKWEEIAQGLLTVQLGLEIANQHNRTDDG